MKGYIALCLVIILSMGLTESQKIDEEAAQKILENYSKNPTSSSNSDLEKAYRANCCDAPNNRGIGGKYYINATLNSFGVKNFLEMTQTLLPIINLLCRIIEKTEESWPNLQMD